MIITSIKTPAQTIPIKPEIPPTLSKGEAGGMAEGDEIASAFDAETPGDEAKRAKFGSDEIALSACIFEITADAKRPDPPT
jgi:hypothetical protein